MKKLTLLFSACFIMLVIMLSACKKDNKESKENNVPSLTAINAQVNKGTDYNTSVDSVYAVLIKKQNGGIAVTFILKKAKYRNGGFSMELTTPPTDFLTKFKNEKHLVFSDTTAKCIKLDELSAIKNNKKVGEFDLTNTVDDKADASKSISFWYVDKNLEVKGSKTEENTSYLNGTEYRYSETEIMNLKFAKGWNILLIEESTERNPDKTIKSKTEKYTVVTSIPSDCKWEFFAQD